MGDGHELSLNSGAVGNADGSNIHLTASGAGGVVSGGGHRDDRAAEAVLAAVSAVVDVDVGDSG